MKKGRFIIVISKNVSDTMKDNNCLMKQKTEKSEPRTLKSIMKKINKSYNNGSRWKKDKKTKQGKDGHAETNIT